MQPASTTSVVKKISNAATETSFSLNDHAFRTKALQINLTQFEHQNNTTINNITFERFEEIVLIAEVSILTSRKEFEYR
jgi:hypothetical protein